MPDPVKYEGAVYVDSPIPAAVRQISPFYEQGLFDRDQVPLLMRKRIGTAFGLFPRQGPSGPRPRMIGGKEAMSMPVRRGGAIYYGFNSQGNMHTVANRKYRHVLILHGESNKRASARPAARLYDHVCVAGELGLERYLDGNIFARSDVESGRLILVGDTFVQPLSGYRVDPDHGEALLYAPTWEGFGGPQNNYSSIGRDWVRMVQLALSGRERMQVIIRPHPYLGLLKPGMIRSLCREVLELAGRIDVRFDLRDANLPTRAMAALLSRIRPGRISTQGPEPSVHMCLTDISAMEAVCLKAGLPHMILAYDFQPRPMLVGVYAEKAISGPVDMSSKLDRYRADWRRIDAEHRNISFGVSHEDFRSADPAVRMKRLQKMIGHRETGPF